MATTSVNFADPFVREYARSVAMGERQASPYLQGKISPSGYFDPNAIPDLYNLINQYDPQAAQQVRFRVGDVRGVDTAGLGANDPLTWKSAADENDWMAPAAMIASFGGAGYLQGAFNGLPGLEGVVGATAPNYASVGGTGGLNDIMGQSFNPGNAAAASNGMTLNNLPNFNAPGASWMTPAGDAGSAVANATGSVVDAVAPAASGVGASGAALPGGWGTALGAAGAAAAGGVGGSAGAGLASALGSGIAGAAGAAAQGAYQFPWGNVIGSVIGAAGANSASKDLADAMRYATDKADPFAQERPFYQGQLKSMYTDPNYFSNSPVMKGLVDTSLDQSQRKLASQGYNYSGNTQSELAKLATNESFKYAQNQQDMTAKAAGAYNGPGAAGTVAATGAAAQMGLNNQLYGNLGAGFQSVLNGSQPTAAQQVNGAGSNQSLSDVFKGWSL